MDFISGTPLAIPLLLVMLFLGFLFFYRFWTMLLGIVSVALAIIAIRRSETGGKGLAVVALVLGTIEIVIVGLRLIAEALI